MTKKIFRSILLAAAAVLLACLLIIMGVLYDYFLSMQDEQFSEQLALAAGGVESAGEDYLRGLETESSRITWIAADGTVLYDSDFSPEAMENHSDREEVQEALESGSGESSRYSSTLTEKTFYRATLLSDGTVLRLSVTQSSILTLVFGMLQPILAVLVLAVLLSALLASRLAKRIVKPLNELDLDQPLENDAYEELSPLLTRIEQQYRQIDAQLNALKRRQNEFSTVTANMSEGLVLLNEKGFVLSINPAAEKIFDTDSECVGRDFLTIDRNRDISAAIQTALQKGRSELRMERAGREYQVDISRIGREDGPDGAALLVFDVTDRVFAERNRREFTANVSHELKTPLQSIMGSAELLESGLVKDEDVPRFVGQIRSESARLMTLIEDIIRLSQLDEGSQLPREKTDLYALAQETVKSLSGAAEAKGVTLAAEGESVTVTGAGRLIQEILFNLCDNAIKYNRRGGSVKVSVSGNEEGAVLTVADTGIGIPPEHQARVFERFYRVDKSHSNQTGGTGLGLSIVKGAAQYLGAKIELESKPDRGTRVTVFFPF
ncbi:MAG: ATP-binding protein [Bacillota bacterium]|nr:ATP-binding protein [Bacillota bacterium]